MDHTNHTAKTPQTPHATEPHAISTIQQCCILQYIALYPETKHGKKNSMPRSPLFLQSSKPLGHHTPYFDGVPPANSTFYQQPALLFALAPPCNATGGSVF